DHGLVSPRGRRRGRAVPVPGADHRLRRALMTAPACRFCRAPLTQDFVDLGLQPLANSYLTQAQLDAGNEGVYPLRTRVCGTCFLVQADDPVAADAIFDDGYAYFSSYSESWVAHAKRYAEAMAARFGLGPQSLII